MKFTKQEVVKTFKQTIKKILKVWKRQKTVKNQTTKKLSLVYNLDVVMRSKSVKGIFGLEQTNANK